MNNPDFFKSLLGKKLELEIISASGDKIGQSYSSQLIDVNEDNIVIIAPIFQTRLKFLVNGTKVKLIYIQENAGVFLITGLVLDNKKDENVFSFTIKPDSDIKKIQRREYFRIDCFLSGNYCIIYEDFKPISEFFDTTVVDLSGIAFLTKL